MEATTPRSLAAALPPAPATTAVPTTTPATGTRPPRPVRRWRYPVPEATETGTGTESLTREARVSEPLARLLVRRGIKTADAVRAFLDPALTQLHDPALLPDMDKAVARLATAIDKAEPILLYADYDVDGTTGAAILSDVLGHLGAKVAVHVPDRVRDGYGLKRARLEQAKAEGVRVVVSIDNGVAALDEARACVELGLDLIVTDHHTMKAELPVAHACVHPRMPGSAYPNPDICGAGVAFKLAWAIARHRAGGPRPSPLLRDRLLAALGLVALGTVADVVPLTGENRALVRHGLKVLELGPTPGIRALLAIANPNGANSRGANAGLDASQIAFRLAPRLNAAGRMGDARRAFELLVAETDERAGVLAAELDRENARRQGIQKETHEAARAEVERVYGVSPSAAALVVAGKDWPLGVVGIVAAKLVEDYRRPVLCLAGHGGDGASPVWKGSGRSVPEVDLLACLERCRGHLDTFGGHAAAVGLSLGREKLDAFRAEWTSAVAAARVAAPSDGKNGASTPGEHVLDIDLEVGLADVHPDLLRELDLLEPFGQGNRAPLLAARDLELAGEPKPMGRSGDHVSFYVKQGDRVVRGVAFGRRDLLDLLRDRGMSRPKRERFEVAFRPKRNEWNGQVTVELEVEDIRFPS